MPSCLTRSGNAYNYTAAVANPQSRLDVSPRFDFQLGANNTLSVRYMFDRQTETNSGVSQFALQSQAYNVANQENTLQLSDTQVLSDQCCERNALPVHARPRQPGCAEQRSHRHRSGSFHRRRKQHGRGTRQSGPL